MENKTKFLTKLNSSYQHKQPQLIYNFWFVPDTNKHALCSWPKLWASGLWPLMIQLVLLSVVCVWKSLLYFSLPLWIHLMEVPLYVSFPDGPLKKIFFFLKLFISQKLLVAWAISLGHLLSHYWECLPNYSLIDQTTFVTVLNLMNKHSMTFNRS